MTNEQILELAENYLEVLISEDNGSGDRPTDFAATSEQLLKFALAIHEDGYNKGYDEGWESSKVSTEMNTWSSDDD